MSFKVECMKFEPLFLRFILVRWVFLTDCCLITNFWRQEVKTDVLLQYFFKKEISLFSAIDHYGFWKMYNCIVFSKNNTWFLLMPSISPKYFVIHLKLTWSTFNFCIKKNCDLDAIRRTRLTKSAKIFKKHGFGQWFLVMPDG